MAETYLIAAGGTGGHLFPGIAVAEELRGRAPLCRIVFVGTPRGLEKAIVPKAGYELELLGVLPLNGVPPAALARGLMALPGALVSAYSLVGRLGPRAVLGVGGYASGPVVLSAAVRGVRTVILEPNAKPGFTNRLLAPFVGRAACAFEETRQAFGKKGVLTGNPIRRGFLRLGRKAHVDPLTLLVVGGSQGSAVLNRAMVASLPGLPGPGRLRIVHQTGPTMRDEVQEAYTRAGREAEVVAFLDAMEEHLGEADLVLARSGATTCAELAAAGRASLLVPFAAAADAHQLKNAQALERAGAAEVLEEKDLSSLAARLTALLGDHERLVAMEQAARSLSRADAASAVADLLVEPASV